ncbi:Dehydrogenases with different specificities (related to short-chain alcohol dehydrogenases) [Acidisarcina polymorpha]|uniref:Dehydrogenases with different specificities (Related to short-chain alcohol dehydrogenases) n=1 Tax=Acidisarcina polymorpha TaxID=2211140 RepID=A0A2Z5FSW0_9BACT|nr:SDR family oxidoreductase [Acidisarcina polymorpha]AXC09852.1 Dehydrogenases with different specificities (related to short-chain alcohol dehydrogenases) [Acidisarcina polymorpha]
MSEPLAYVILGAYGGIGSELARQLAQKGAKLLLVGRDEARLAALTSELGASYAVAEATSSAQIEASIAQAVESFGSVYGVANCFGSLLLKPAHLTSDEELESTLAINLKSAFAVTRATGRLLKTGGSVVFVSSAAARLGMANHEAIAAAKAGIQGLALAAAASYAPRNLRFNCVAPGLTRTPLTERITGNETVAKGSLAMHALGRFGEPADVASAIEWLLDPRQHWITGQILGVDGGLATVRARGGA